MTILGSDFDNWIAQTEEDLEQHEAYRKHVYDDATGAAPPMQLKGNLTIGIGFNLSAGISKPLALVIMRHQLSHVILDLETRFSWWPRLSGNRKRALANLCFNMGMGWAKTTTNQGRGLLSFTKALRAMEDENYSKAADEFLDSSYARKVGANRSKFVTDLIRNG
jgi:lysozyme